MKRLIILIVLIGVAGGVGGYVIAAHGGGGDTIDPKGNFSVSAARAFDEFPIYSVGDRFQDLPLTGVLRRFDPSSSAGPVRENFVSFLYGECAPQGGSGCALPLEIQVWPACERNASVYAGGPASDAAEPIAVRGLAATYFGALGRPRLEFTTGTSTVVIFGRTREQVVAAANALRGVNHELDGRAPLPSPAEGAQYGALKCPYDP